MQQVYKILDEYLMKASSTPAIDNDREECKEIFKSIKNENFKFLKDIGDENSIAGIIMCFKSFKNMSKFNYNYSI